MRHPYTLFTIYRHFLLHPYCSILLPERELKWSSGKAHRHKKWNIKCLIGKYCRARKLQREMLQVIMYTSTKRQAWALAHECNMQMLFLVIMIASSHMFKTLCGAIMQTQNEIFVLGIFINTTFFCISAIAQQRNPHHAQIYNESAEK